MVEDGRRKAQLAAACLFAASCALVIAGSLWLLDSLTGYEVTTADGDKMHAPPGPGLFFLGAVPFFMIPIAGLGAAMAAVLVWRTLSGTLLVEGEVLKNALLGLAMFATPMLLAFDVSDAWTFLVVLMAFFGWWIAAIAVTRSAFSRRHPANAAAG